MSNSAIRCDECYDELVKAMNRWNTFLTARAYHPLKVVHASSSNMKIRMKRCHVDWEGSICGSSRLVGSVNPEARRPHGLFVRDSSEEQIRELRNDLLTKV